jgi:hypothetical protein
MRYTRNGVMIIRVIMVAGKSLSQGLKYTRNGVMIIRVIMVAGKG